MIRHLGDLFTVLSLLTALAFMVIYARREWRNRIGFNLMSMAAVVAIAAGFSSIRVIWPHAWESYRDGIRLVMWGLVFLVMAFRVALLVHPTAAPKGVHNGVRTHPRVGGDRQEGR